MISFPYYTDVSGNIILEATLNLWGYCNYFAESTRGIQSQSLSHIHKYDNNRTIYTSKKDQAIRVSAEFIPHKILQIDQGEMDSCVQC